MRMNLLPITCFLLCLLITCPGWTAEYRVDSQEAFNRLKGNRYEPGDSILFKRGSSFNGMFEPKGSGKQGKPIQVGTYGNETGPLPVIHAKGQHKAGLFLHNSSFWAIDGLEITNTDGSDADQGDLFGIFVLADSTEGLFEHIYISNCSVHDVNGKVAGKRRGGIHVHIKGLTKSRFHDLRITNNRILRVGGVGIGNTSSCGKVSLNRDGTYTAKNLWTKVYVADNHVDRTGRNCIIARVSKDAIYERNVLANSSRYSTGHSIFNFNTDGIKIQYNEAYGNVGPGGKDRGGFDADYNSVNTYIQYNYSHDNLWFCGIMKRPNHNVIIRHNISINDTHGIYFYGFEGEKKATQIQIYNNTHYVKKGLPAKVFAEDRTPINSTFERNIFYFEGKGSWGEKAKGVNATFKNNIYINIAPHATDIQAQVRDPLFLSPGKAPTEIDLRTMKALDGYRLSKASPYGQHSADNTGYGAQIPAQPSGDIEELDSEQSPAGDRLKAAPEE
jgi:hypothetical protein